MILDVVSDREAIERVQEIAGDVIDRLAASAGPVLPASVDPESVVIIDRREYERKKWKRRVATAIAVVFSSGVACLTIYTFIEHQVTE